MKLAAVQYRPPKGDPRRARSELSVLVAEAGAGGADVIVCPEMATTGYLWPSADAIRPHCELAGGATFEALAPLAVAHKAWIVVGFAELAPDGLYNSALVIDPEGRVAACYRKVLLYPADTTWALAGQRRVLLPTAHGRLVPGICMDLNDDGFVGFLFGAAPDVVAFCTNWIEEGIDTHAYWSLRLLGWTGWFVAANSWGFDGGTEFSGRSAILGPRGQVRASLGPVGNGVLILDTSDAVTSD